MRHSSLSLRRATAKVAPVCVTCLPCTLNVMDEGNHHVCVVAGDGQFGWLYPFMLRAPKHEDD